MWWKSPYWRVKIALLGEWPGLLGGPGLEIICWLVQSIVRLSRGWLVEQGEGFFHFFVNGPSIFDRDALAAVMTIPDPGEC